jgi:hypothetical protein
MAQRRGALGTLRLEFAQVVDVAHADGELGEMQHGPATRGLVRLHRLCPGTVRGVSPFEASSSIAALREIG